MNTKTFSIGIVPCACLLAAALVGCSECATDMSRFCAPDQVVHAPHKATISPIRANVSLADETQELVPNATFPAEDDYVYSDKDYVIGPGDELQVNIMDLYQAGAETPLQREVAESGLIDLPLLPNRIKAEGLTKEELKDAIVAAYSPDILRNATVSVSILQRKQNTFSVLGAIARTGTYNILRKDMRMLEALALAGDITQQNIHYIYVIRPSPAVRKAETEQGLAPGRTGAVEELPALPTEAMPVPISRSAPSTSTSAASGQASAPATGRAETRAAVRAPAAATAQAAATAKAPPAGQAPLTPTQPGAQQDLRELENALPQPAGAKEPQTLPAPSATPQMTEMASLPASSAAASEPQAPARTAKWMYINGRFVRTEQEVPASNPAPTGGHEGQARPANLPLTVRSKEKDEDPFSWKKVQKTDLARIIAINYDKLKEGDPRMNIVIRDNDVIQVPLPETGEFYLMGEIIRPGVYSLTGRLITVKMAVAAAGNLTQTSWPRNSILIRRVGRDQEQTIPIDIEAIFHGEASDIYLKPDDLICVGSDIRTPFLAVMRNAYRFSYGFGFVYDRNFDDPALGDTTLTSHRFTRW